MRKISPEQFNDFVQQAHVRPRLRRELRYGSSIADIPEDTWSEMEMISISDRSGNQGVLVIELGDDLFILPYELSRGLADKSTGRSRAIICDICTTWQAGGNTASITINNTKTTHNVTYLCCGDLKCSLHVRSKTRESLLSRSQLREDLNNEQRAERLRQKLQKLVDTFGLQPVGVEQKAS